MKKNEHKAAFLRAMLANLIDLARADTLYHDVYISRARYYLKQELSHDGYLNLNRMKIREASLPNQIRNAMNCGDWHEVYELSGLYKNLQERLEGKKTLEEFA